MNEGLEAFSSRDPRTARYELVRSFFDMSAPTRTEWCVDPWYQEQKIFVLGAGSSSNYSSDIICMELDVSNDGLV